MPNVRWRVLASHLPGWGITRRGSTAGDVGHIPLVPALGVGAQRGVSEDGLRAICVPDKQRPRVTYASLLDRPQCHISDGHIPLVPGLGVGAQRGMSDYGLRAKCALACVGVTPPRLGDHAPGVNCGGRRPYPIGSGFRGWGPARGE